ncbi:MAG: thioredoxin family protein [Saprospiraceae bacterium]|nr:thioredoxin family protein [Saprospiraceae bacterium]MBK6564331.1 thioredoxin family protein [Saprospiraceae bacterium]MBK6782501.1 thioredoxin family protein [Saprospiraceae bacterium]MBK7523987.1 thioredoxin family protein [Saprospiraceae bacterium]MBK8079046.1 thioredoxin family protein [Saprospiraceae bacterium]
MIIKSWIYVPVLILFSASLVTCQNNQVQNSDVVNTPTTEKLQENVYKAENEGWLVNVEEAYQISQKTGRPILANFTGSDWCGWCKRLTASVFIKDEFKKWAAENVVLLELDFPRKKTIPAEIQQQNAGMQQAFQVRGYPTIWVFNLDKDAATNQFQVKALGSTGYKATPEEFIADVNNMIKK